MENAWQRACLLRWRHCRRAPWTLTVGAPGHEVVEVEAVVPAGGVESLDLTLEPAFGTLTLALVPADAEVEFLDIEESYVAGMSLAEGAHRLTVSRQGHAPATHTVEVLGATGYEVTLEPLPHPFTLAANPPGAAVFFEDSDMAYTEGMELMPGEYGLEVRLLGYEPWFGTVRHGIGPTIHAVSLTFVSHEYTDELPSGGAGPLMTVVPAGSFVRGCTTLASCPESELPVHDVRIEHPFAMSRHEVTFADFDRFVQATGHLRPDDQGWGRSNRPVISVSWEDATAYTEWLSSETGPTLPPANRSRMGVRCTRRQRDGIRLWRHRRGQCQLRWLHAAQRRSHGSGGPVCGQCVGTARHARQRLGVDAGLFCRLLRECA